MQVIAQFCKKLRKLTHGGWVTYTGLIALAEGCTNLEYLKVKVRHMSNEAMERVGTYLKNLRKFRIISNTRYAKVDKPLDNGIRAMITSCNKLERLYIILQRGELTDAGLGYIGKYGRNLKHLSLNRIGESDAGLMELSKGCPKLRKLRMIDCPFSMQAVATFMQNNHSISFIWVD
ncbi:leucine-rich repeat, cysteine-containing subtype protein [Tanacetum coccineum]